MAGLFDADANAGSAVIGGQRADDWFSPQAPAGLRLPTAGALPRSQATFDAVMATSRPAPAAPQPQVLYNQATDSFWDGRGEVHSGNLSAVDNGLKSGALLHQGGPVPPGFEALPASQVQEYLQTTAANRGAGSAMGEIGHQLVQGTRSLGGQVVRTLAVPFDAEGGVNKGVNAAADWVQGDQTPDTYGRNPVSAGLIKAANVAGMVIPITAVNLLAAAQPEFAPAAFAANTGFMGAMGGSTYESKFHEAKEQGMSDSDARTFAGIHAGIMTAGAAAFGAGAGKVLGAAGKVTAGTVPEAVAQATSGKWGAEAAGNIARHGVLDAGMFGALNAAGTATDHAYGLNEDQSVMGSALEGAATGALMTPFMAPFGAVSARRNAQYRSALGHAIDDVSNPVNLLEASRQVRSAIEPTVGEGPAGTWMAEQFGRMNDAHLRSLDEGQKAETQAQIDKWVPSEHLALPGSVIPAEGDASQVPMGRLDALKPTDTSAMEKANEDLWNQRNQHEADSAYNYNTQRDSVPLPTDLGSAKAVLDLAHRTSLGDNPQAIVEGSDLHKAVLRAQEIYDANGVKYVSPEVTPAPVVIKEATKKPSKQQVKLDAAVAELEKLGVDEPTLQLARQHADNNKLGQLNALVKEARAAKGEPPNTPVETAEQALQRKANAAKAAKTSMSEVPKEAQPGEALPAAVEKSAPPDLSTPEGRNDLKKKATTVLTPQEQAVLERRFGGKFGGEITAERIMELRKLLEAEEKKKSGVTTLDKKQQIKVDNQLAALTIDKEGEEDTGGASHRVVAKELGGNRHPAFPRSLSHETARKLANSGLAKLEALAEKHGMNKEDVLEALGFKSDAVSDHMNTISEAEAASLGLSYRRSGPRVAHDYAGSHGDEFDHTAGMSRDETATEGKDGEAVTEVDAGDHVQLERTAEDDAAAAPSDVAPKDDTKSTPVNHIEQMLAPFRDALDAIKDKLGEKQTAGVERIINRAADALADARTGEEKKAILEKLQGQVETYQDQAKKGIQYSKSQPKPGEKTTTIDRIRAALKGWFFSGERFDRKVTLVQKFDELEQSIKDALGAKDSKDAAGTQAFVMNGRAYLIADNIKPGQELAVFLHEVGVHLGMEKLLGPTNYNKLKSQISKWHGQKGVEGDIARKAMDRVMNADDERAKRGEDDMAPSEAGDELLAYFVEEAVNAGIDPTALHKVTGPMREWFRTLYAAMKAALRKFGFDRLDKMTAKDVVNIAYGAARLELEGSWHGTASEHRKFDHTFMGTGEGAQAFGWGSYLAQRVGIAKGYWKTDVQNKNRVMTYSAIGNAIFAALDRQSRTDWTVPDLLRAVGMKDHHNIDNIKASMPFSLDHVVTLANSGLSGSDIESKLKDRGSLFRMDHSITDGEMLDWDKPLSEQHPEVQEKLKQDDRLSEFFSDTFKGDALTSGQAIYRKLQAALAGSMLAKGGDKAASEYLDSIGIKGHRFLDANSRQKPSYRTYPDKMSLDRVADDHGNGRTGSDLAGEIENYGAEEVIKIWGIDPNGARDVWAYESFLTSKSEPPTHNIVVYNDKNIQRAMTEKGANRDKIQFSIAAVEDTIAKLPEDQRKTAEKTVAAMKGFAEKWMGGAFLGDLVDVGKKYVKALGDFYDAKKNQGATAYRLNERVNDFARLAQGLKQEDYKAAYGVINQMDSTKKWGYDPKRAYKVEVDPKLKAEFDKLSPGAKKVVQEAFKLTHDMMGEQKLGLLDRANATLDEAIVRAEGDEKKIAKANDDYKDAASRIKGDFPEAAGPYAPQTRYGDFFVVAKSAKYLAAEEAYKASRNKETTAALDELRKDGKHYFVATRDRGEAKILADKLRAHADFSNGGTAEHFRKDVFSRDHEAPYAQVEKLKEMLLHADDKEVPSKVRNAALASLDELYLKTLSDLSSRHASQRREGIAGYDEDRIKSIVDHSRSAAHLVALLTHSGQVHKAVLDIKQQAHDGYYLKDPKGKDVPENRVKLEGDKDKRKQYANEVLLRHALNMIHLDTSVQNKFLQFTAGMKVVTSPGFYLQQFTEPFMVMLPVLAGKHGYGKALSTMWAAKSEAMKLVKVLTGNEPFTADRYVSPKGDAETERIREMLHYLTSRGRIDLGQLTDLGDMDMGTTSKVFHTMFGRFNRIATNMEAVNRLTSSITAYRLEFEKNGGDHKAAIDATDKQVRISHGEYDAFSAPRFMMQQNWAGMGLPIKLITQFKKFQVMELSLMARLTHQAFKGATHDERVMGRQALAFTFAQYAVMTGAMGLPGYGVASTIVDWLFKDSKEPLDPDMHMREFLSKHMGPEMADLLTTGVPGGLGVPLTKRIGAGGMTSVVPLDNMDLTDRSHAAEMALSMMGPFIGLLTNDALGAYTKMRQGDYYKGMEQMSPTILRNSMKAYRQATEGITNSKNDVLVKADDLNMVHAALQVAGFQTSKLELRQMVESYKYSEETYYKTRFERLSHEYAKAARDRDTDTMAGLREKWGEYQEAQRGIGLVPTPIGGLYKAPAEQTKREIMTEGGVQWNKRNRGMVVDKANM